MSGANAEQVGKALTFQEKIKARVIDGIADFITDEELKKLIDHATKEAFFEDRVVRDNWGNEKSRVPGLLPGLVKELMAERIREEVRIWLKDNEPHVKATVDKIVQEGVGTAVFAAMQNIFRNDLQQFAYTVQTTLNNLPR